MTKYENHHVYLWLGGGIILTSKKFCNGKTGTKANMEREDKA
jgi:hypothetical protein